MTRRKMIAGTVALTTALSALVWIVKTRFVEPPAALLRIACVPSETHGFTVDYESHGRLLDSSMGLPVGGASSTQAVDIAVRGRAVETCVESDAQKRVFALDFADVDGEVVIEPGTRQAVAALLVGTTFVELQPDGAVGAIHFARAMPELGQNIVRDLLSHRSMKLAPRAAHEWRTEEVNIDGSYPATYRIERVAGDGVHLTKQRADAPISRTQLIERPQVHYLAGSIAKIRIDRSWLGDLDSTTRVEIISGTKVVATTTTRLALRGAATGPRSVDGLRTMLLSLRTSGAPVGDLAASEADRRIDEKMQREELKDETWASLWARARDAQSDEAKTFLQLRALFTLHPEACKDAAAALASIDSVQDKAFMTLVSALASTGTPEAQAALLAARDGARGKREPREV
ncbi:MAG: hypothetical protein H7138_16875, partial [Myxococcales bacterium]|nr:hypothetical protein [Myxococcales bacterium]